MIAYTCHGRCRPTAPKAGCASSAVTAQSTAREADIDQHERPGGDEPEYGPGDRAGESVHRAGAVEAAGEDDKGVGDKAHGHRGDELDQGGPAAGDAGEDGGRDYHSRRGALDTHGLGDRPEETQTSRAEPPRFACVRISRCCRAYLHGSRWSCCPPARHPRSAYRPPLRCRGACARHIGRLLTRPLRPPVMIHARFGLPSIGAQPGDCPVPVSPGTWPEAPVRGCELRRQARMGDRANRQRHVSPPPCRGTVRVGVHGEREGAGSAGAEACVRTDEGPAVTVARDDLASS